MRRATLDTNILVSAFQFGGKPQTLIQMALDGEIEIAISQPIIDETIRILKDKFGWSTADLGGVLSVIRSCTTFVTPTDRLEVVDSDADDNRIVECAVASGSSVIVTGDKHLLRLGRYSGISILRVREFLMS
jgi:putative PIN family toxin of toxin-antitoxin system